MSCGIYMILNNINQHKYIGQSKCIEHRWKEHKYNAYNKNQHYNFAIYQAIRKYGIENFSFLILEECTEEELDKKEIYWIEYYNTFKGEGYNMTSGGQGFSNSLDIDLKEVQRLWNNGLAVKEIIEYYSCHPSTIRKILQQCPNYSEEEARIRGGLKAREQIAKENTNYYNKSIIQYDLEGNIINSFPSLKAIKRELNFDSKAIKNCIEGKSFSSHNYRWGLQGNFLKSKEEIEKEKHQKNCERNSQAKLDWETVNKIWDLLKNTNKSQRVIGEMFGVSAGQISNINIGKSWKSENQSYPIRNK